jgi:hypothetical protein
LTIRQAQPDNGAPPFLLALFTTQPSSPAEVFELYGRRWAIETDLRTLKSTLQLDQLTCSTPDMVAKEIDMAMAAYNLVTRHDCFGVGAERCSAPRVQLYEGSQNRRDVRPGPCRCPERANCQAYLRSDDGVRSAIQAPTRKRKRPSYPRAVWRGEAPFRITRDDSYALHSKTMRH